MCNESGGISGSESEWQRQSTVIEMQIASIYTVFACEHALEPSEGFCWLLASIERLTLTRLLREHCGMCVFGMCALIM